MEDQISNKATFKYKLKLFYTSEKIWSLSFFYEYINNTHCPTFHHHNGKSNSQIDYILENIQSNILLDTKIEEQHQLKGSAHVPVRTKTTLVISLNKGQAKKQKHKTILNWEETNIPSYQDAIEKAVLENLSNSSDIDIQAEDIINLIVTASNTNVTNKTVTLKGPSWKASPPVKELHGKE